MVLSADYSYTLQQHFGIYSCAVVPDNMAVFYVTLLRALGAGSLATALTVVHSMKPGSGNYTCVVERFT